MSIRKYFNKRIYFDKRNLWFYKLTQLFRLNCIYKITLDFVLSKLYVVTLDQK